MGTFQTRVAPRSYAGTALIFGSATALPFGLLSSWLVAGIVKQPFGDLLRFGLVAGLLFGALFGLAMAVFLRGWTATVAYHDKAAFRARLNVAASQLGYQPEWESERFLGFKPSFHAGLAAGRIGVQLQEGEAVIVGPKIYVRKLIEQVASV